MSSNVSRHDSLISMYVLMAIDIIAIIVSYMLSYYFRFGSVSFFQNDAHKTAVLCLIIACIIYSFSLEWNRSIVTRGYLVELVCVSKYNAVLLIITAMLVFLLRQGEFYSRLVFGYFAIINELLVYALHILCKLAMRKYMTSDRSRIRVMLITEWSLLESTINSLKNSMPANYDISSLVIWDKDLSGSEQYGIPVVANRDNLIDIATGLPLDEVMINLPNQSVSMLGQLIESVETMGAVCHYSIDVTGNRQSGSRLEQFGDYTVLSYSLTELDYRRLLIKRLIDIIGSIVGLCITLICFPFIAIAIKVDSKGPVIFSQNRVGKNGRIFRLYKFRSMYIDAEERKKQLMKDNEVDGLMFKMENDPRITKVGRFLRKTSLDELPQFYNILLGDMSLVGTRPPTEDEFRQYSAYYKRRLCMTPGLTGMWQVSGRSDIKDFDEVVRLDLKYIDDWSLTLDLKILVQTIGVVFSRKGSK